MNDILYQLRNFKRDIKLFQSDPILRRAIRDVCREHAEKEISIPLVNKKTGKTKMIKGRREILLIEKVITTFRKNRDFKAYKLIMDMAHGRVSARRAKKRNFDSGENFQE